jgi:hypothetical protein
MWASSLTESTAKGKPDIEAVDVTSRTNTLHDVLEVTTKPIVYDADTGGKIEHFQFTVRTLERLGVSAAVIEDKVGLKKNSLFGTDVPQTQDTIEGFCEKIKAGKAAQVTDDFMIVARIESLILDQGIDDAIARADAYMEAGADAVLIHSRQKAPDEIFEFCDRFGKLKQRVDLGDEHQMVLELRPAHDPRKLWGFVGVVISVEDLSASVWLWHRDDDGWSAKKVITIPAEPAEASELPPALQPFGAVPPLVSDIDLSVDDRWLYVSCWGAGELKQYDVSDPHNPREAGSVRLGGIVGRTPHPAAAELRLAGGPQMVEVSRDGRRVYFTNSLYASWDDIFYPDGVGAWMARVDANTETGGMTVDPKFFPHDDDFRGLRIHQTRLQGGDASSDSYCFVD